MGLIAEALTKKPACRSCFLIRYSKTIVSIGYNLAAPALPCYRDGTAHNGTACAENVVPLRRINCRFHRDRQRY